MEKPNQDDIHRMEYEQFGPGRWENSEKNRKRKSRSGSFDAEAPTLTNMEHPTKSDVPDNNLVPAGWDEALLKRLQPAKKTTNHKRPLAQDIEIVTFSQLQFNFNDCNKQNVSKRAQRPQSEDPSNEACARKRRQLYQNNEAYLIVEHDGSEMSRSSPGHRKYRHSSSKADVVDLSNDPKLPLPLTEEGEDSADSLEIEDVGRVVSAKRVQPNSGGIAREHRGTPDLSHPIKTVSSGGAGILRSDRSIHRSEEIGASEQGNERDQKEAGESKVPSARKWDYFSGYKDRRPSSIRDFGNPSFAAPVPVPSSSPEEESMAPVPGGLKPVNRLGYQASNTKRNPNPAYKKPVPKFDLHEGHTRRDEHSSKRQRIEGTPISRNGSSKSPINLEEESVDSSRQMRPPASRSGLSQAQNGRQFGVEEYHKVEKTVGFASQGRRSRKSNSSGSQSSSGRGGKQFLPTPSRDTIMRLDDVQDPISDHEDEVVEARHVRKGAPQSAGKTTLEVQITVSRQGESTTGYQGTSNRQTSRPKKKIWGNGDFQQPTETPEFSRYFPTTENRAPRNSSNGFHSADDTAPGRTSARSLNQQSGNSSTKETSPEESSPILDPDVSVDELNSDDLSKESAQTLLAEYKKAVSADKSSGRRIQKQSIPLEDFSDDDLAKNPADMTEVEFTSSSKVKSKKQPGEVRYDVVQVFSKSDKWLLASSRQRWSLHENCKAGLLTIFDEHGSAVPDLVLVPHSITKIIWGTDNAKLLIHKPIDQTAKRASQICLELSHRDDGADLVERIKKLTPNLGAVPKEGAHLDKIFENALNQPPSTMKKDPPSRKDPDDLILAQEKSNARHAAKWNAAQERKKSTTNGRLIDQLQSSNTDARSERNISRSTRSQQDSQLSDDGEPAQDLQTYEVPLDTFYGGRTTRRPSGSSLYETRSSTRAADRGQKLRQQRPRSPSPPPRWTAQNPGWAKKWQSSIIYPSEGKNRATVDKGDITKLDEGEFLNDNLIIFYLRWLQHRLEKEHPEWAKRIYFQNTFFYERLTHPEKGTKGINYAAVERWTAKVNLLEYDYIIIPVNENTHWYVAIICNAPRLLSSAELADRPQPQGATEAVDDEQIRGQEMTDATSVSAASPKQTSEIPRDGEVDDDMRDMSLDDKKPEDAEEREWPDDNLDPAPMPRTLPQSVSSVHNSPKRQDVTKTSSPAPATVTSDLAVSAILTANQIKKSKRKSIPTPRKYNPKEFRIITLDSLGSPHSATCTHLKDYLVLEIKAKLNIDIPRPGSIGTTAKNIPIQTNFYDCGLFLLSYIEKFLEEPDVFVHDILQNQLDVDIQWPKASDMRGRIRDLLFDLQKEQVAEAERFGKGKGKGKKAPKTESKVELALSTKSSSREASKSVRASPDAQTSDKARVAQKNIVGPKQELSTKEEPSKPWKSASAEPPLSREAGKLNGVDLRASPGKSDLPKLDKPASREVLTLDTASQEPPQAHVTRFNGFISKVSNFTASFLGHEKAKSPAEVSKLPLLRDNVIEIKESPQKADRRKGRLRSRDSEIQDSSRTVVQDDAEIFENGSSTFEFFKKREDSKAQHQRSTQTLQRSPPRDLSPNLSVPAPAVKSSFRQFSSVDNNHEVKSRISKNLRPPDQDSIEIDLRSPSPEIGRTSSRQGSTENHHSALSSPDSDAPSLGVYDRRPSIHPAKRRRSQEPNEEWKGIQDDREIRNSEDDGDDDEMQLVEPDLRLIDEASENAEAPSADDQMLLSNSLQRLESQDEASETADPALLSSSPASKPVSHSTPKKRERSRSTAPSPAQTHEEVMRNSNTSPYRGRKRKNMADTENWQEHYRPSQPMRDASDSAIIGKYGKMGKHIRFPE